MFKNSVFIILVLISSKSMAWGYMNGEVEIIHANTYGNHNSNFLNGGFCFKLKGHDEYLKLRYHDGGEQRAVYDFVQSLVLAAYMAKKEVKTVYVDWGTDPTCRVKGSSRPAKWVEDVMLTN